MRALFILAFIANVALIIVSLVILPSKMAIHFGPGGMPDSWASKEVNALIFLGINVVLFICLYLSPLFTEIFPRRLISLPHKDYWLKEENKPELNLKMASLSHEFGAFLFIFLFFINLLVLRANLSDPVRLNERHFFPLLIVFFLYVIYWAVKCFLVFRPPKRT